jgi:protein TonB
MVKSHSRFGKPSWALDALSGETGETEQAVDFQFSVTWSSLFAPVPTSKTTDAVVPVNHRVPTLVSAAKEPPPPREETALARQFVEEPSPAERQKADSTSTVSWEMVVPKMVRPSAKAPLPEAAPPIFASGEKKISRLQLTRLAIALAITLVGIFVLLIVHRWVSGPKQAVPAQTAVSSLKLEVEQQGNGLINIRWNPKGAPVAQAREARLVILERDQQPRIVALDSEQLKAGHLPYRSTTERVVLRLEVVDRSGAITKDSTLALLPEMATPPTAQAPVEAANPPRPPSQVPAVSNVRAKVDSSHILGDPGERAERPIIRAFTPPRPIRDPGERPAILLDPPDAVPSGSSVAPIRFAEPSNRISPPSVKQVLAAPASPAAPIKVGGNLQAGKLLKKVTPIYPQMAAIAHLQGTVRLTALIGKDGTIQNLQLVSGPSLLAKAATDAVKQWVYQPTVLNGEPVEVQTQIDVNFNLNQ